MLCTASPGCVLEYSPTLLLAIGGTGRLIEEIDTVEEVERAVADPDALLDRAAAIAREAVIEHLASKVKATIRPMVEKRGWPWEPVEKILEDIDTPEELQVVMSDVDGFLKKVSSILIDELMVKAKAMVQPCVEARGWPWPPVEKVLEEIDTPEKLQAVVADVDGFLKKVSSVVIDELMVKAKAMVQACVEAREWPWPPVEKVLEEIGSVDELQAAMADPETFLGKMKDIALEAVMAKARTTLRRHARTMHKQYDISWELVEEHLDKIDSPKELEAIVAHPEVFMQQIATKS
jgi:fructose-specific component phosphotransferase system IIB-like protein